MLRALVLTGFFALAAANGAVLHAQPASGQPLAALDGLERGEWELRSRDANTPPIRVCASDIRQLLQPRHPGLSCTRYVIEDRPNRATITYDCARGGQGRTTLRVETARLVQIDSQGVTGGGPFAIIAEARRVGACGPQTANR